MRAFASILIGVHFIGVAVCGYELNVENFVSSLDLSPRDSVYEIGRKLHAHATNLTSQLLSQHDHVIASEYPYFNVFPQHRANILPDTTTEVQISKYASQYFLLFNTGIVVCVVLS